MGSPPDSGIETIKEVMHVFDYIVIGAGSAGCVMAARLAEAHSVLLIEAGRANPALYFRLHMPAALSEVLTSTRYNWAFETEPEPFLGQRNLYCPRGKVVGGSSSINGMIFVRGHAEDFNRWSEVYGASGWSYEDVLPFFKASETKAGGDPDYRGHTGPLKITNGDTSSPLCQAWLEAGESLGFGRTPDFNGETQEGFGPFDRTVADGLRQSVARAYLSPKNNLGLSGLTILTQAEVQHIAFDGDRAAGVQVLVDGRLKSFQASREIILCAGAIKSPQVLMRSGIGSESALKASGIECLAPRDEVGQNLQDHLEVYVQAACPKPVSLYPSTRGLRKLAVGAQWYLTKRGDGATNHFHTGAFLRSGLDYGYPDLQFHFLPVAMDYDGKDSYRGHGFQVHVGPMKPTSRGSITLNPKDPGLAPKILFNYNATEQDQQVMQRGIELARELINSPPFSELKGKELRPGPVDLPDFVHRFGESAYHPSGTCRMGRDADAVVAPDGVVNGVSGLRVVDASIMPEITNGNLNAVVIMMAEKIAAQILKR